MSSRPRRASIVKAYVAVAHLLGELDRVMQDRASV